MSNLISIDPGNDTGWADWLQGKLTACGLGEPTFRLGARYVIEKPQVYRASRSVGDPNDLITLAVQVGEYKARARYSNATEIDLPVPGDWKGQVPKNTHAARIRAALSYQELNILSHALAAVAEKKRHNVIDAVGLGLWKLGRLGRGGV